MGHQQLLLIVLTTFVVVFAIAVGFKLFETSTVESNRDQVISDLVYLSSDAQAYYKKQVGYGGGGGSFQGWSIPDFYKRYEGGKIRVKIKAKKDKVILTGIGTEIGKNGKTKVRVKAVIKPTETTITIKN